MNNYYIYLHIKNDNGEPFYIGKGKGNRFKYVKNRSNFWKNITNKHGFDVIFLDINLTENEALEKEKYWIYKIGRRDLGLGPLVNLTNGGEGSSGYKQTKEHKSKIKNALTGSKNPFYGKKHSEDSLSKIKNANIGNKNHQGHKHSEEVKNKMSEKRKGVEPWNKGLKLGIKKNIPIYQYTIKGEFIKEFDCLITTQKELNLYHIRDVCEGKRKSCGGFKWVYKNKEDKL